MKEKILVFIPMYNCEKQIVRVLEQFSGKVKEYISEIIIVNNRSTDNGEQKVIDKIEKMNVPFKIKLMRNCANYGLGGSHKVAFDYAIKNKYDYMIVLHGDDQGDINDLFNVLKNKLYKNYDCILGGRFCKNSKLIGYSKFRTLGNKIFNVIFSVAVRRRIYDLGAGLNMYSINMLKQIHYHKFPDNLTFNCYMLFALAVYRHKHCFIPITWREEDQISNVKMTKQALQTLKMAVYFFVFGKKFMLSDARTEKHEFYESECIYEIGDK